MLPKMKEQLLMICEHVKQFIFPFFPQIEQLDILLSGSMCSYTWNDTSDLDVFIVTNDIIPENKKLSTHLFNCMSRFLVNQSSKPSVYGHEVDAGVIPLAKYMDFYNEITPPCELYAYEAYSIINNRWICEPLKTKYPFSIEQLYEEYLTFCKELEDYSNSLEKTSDDFLTLESQTNLRNKLAAIKREAFMSKEHDALHEYTVKYNLFRVGKKLKLFDKYQQLINQSFDNIIGGNDGRMD